MATGRIPAVQNASTLAGATLATNVTASSLTSLGATAVAPAGTLSGATLSSSVTASSLTSFGTSPALTTPTISTATTNGDILYGTGSGALARLGIGSASQVLSVSGGIPSWAAASSGGMTLINSGGTTLTGSSITISSIPSSYKALKIYIRNPLMGTSGWGLFMRFNADSTANYHYWGQIGTTLYGAPGWNATKISVASDNGTNAQGLGLISIDIPDYANATSWKMAISSALTVSDNATTGLQYQTTQGSYYSTGAITSLQFLSGIGSLTSGTVYIYGVN